MLGMTELKLPLLPSPASFQASKPNSLGWFRDLIISRAESQKNFPRACIAPLARLLAAFIIMLLSRPARPQAKGPAAAAGGHLPGILFATMAGTDIWPGQGRAAD